ncbi:MAG: protein kinase, partial [Polyangiaceae bacterium]|nr:protein kinase [Polyangiaceae bacterium]
TVGRWVALKIMRYDRGSDAEARARFEREARAMSRLVSPHTVTIYDFGQAQDGSVFLAMELLEGESLGTRLARQGRLSVHESVRIARDTLASLAEAHAKGIIHRDLKPDNLFLTELPAVAEPQRREICKLLDFGIAKMIRDERATDALETQAGTVFGTPRYMSPEQAQGKRLDARTDIYALGVILYQMVTGRVPFDDEDAVVVMARHIKTTPRSPRDVASDAGIPEQLERVILRALAKEPGDRPDSANTMILALDAAEWAFSAALQPTSMALRSGYLAVVRGDPLPTLAPSTVRRRRRALAAVVAGVVLAVVVGTSALWRRRLSAAPVSVQSEASALVREQLPVARDPKIVFEGLPDELEPPVLNAPAGAAAQPLAADSLSEAATGEHARLPRLSPSSSRTARANPMVPPSLPMSARPPSTETDALQPRPTVPSAPTDSSMPQPPPVKTRRYERFE